MDVASQQVYYHRLRSRVDGEKYTIRSQCLTNLHPIFHEDPYSLDRSKTYGRRHV